MEERFTNLKNTFIEIIQVKESNIATLQVLLTRIQKIKECYTDFILSNQDTLSIFTLDSFHFQGRLIDIEYEDMNRLFLSISNRMYCDYYKLFKIMVEYIEENITDKKLLELIQINKTQYPVYKDLEPFKQYEIVYIQNIHELLLVFLHYLNGFVIKKEHDLHQYQTKNKIGFNIGSFVHSFNYNNIVIKEKMNLFVTFMEFFHSSHMKYLKRFTTKLQLMLSQVNNDIKLENPSVEKDNKKMAIQDLKSANIDREILHDLKKAIGDEDISITSSDRSNSDPPLIQNMDSISDNFLIETNIRTNVSELTDDNRPSSPAKFSKIRDNRIRYELTGIPCETPNVTPEETSCNSYQESIDTSNQTESPRESQSESPRESQSESPRESQEGSQEESQSESPRESQSESPRESQEESLISESSYLLEPLE
jgi:hypothetical protein